MNQLISSNDVYSSFLIGKDKDFGDFSINQLNDLNMQNNPVPGITDPYLPNSAIPGYAKIVGNIENVYSSITQLETEIDLKVAKNDVINQINISTEGIRITGNKITVTGSTVFQSGYDPSTKETPTGAQAKVDALATALGDLAYEDLVQVAKLGSTIIEGGYIKTTLLTADNIVTGTLTGRTVQTAFSGTRVEINGSSNYLRWYSGASGVGYMQGATVNIGGVDTNVIRLRETSLSNYVWMAINGSSYVNRNLYVENGGRMRLPVGTNLYGLV